MARPKGFLRKSLRNWHSIVTLKMSPLTRPSLKCIKRPALKKKESIGKSRGGNTTKIHFAVDSLGNPLKVKVTGVQVHDVTIASEVIADIKAQIILADATYDAMTFLEPRLALNCVAIAKSKFHLTKSNISNTIKLNVW